MITTDNYVIRFKHENLHKIVNLLENTEHSESENRESVAGLVTTILSLLGENLNGRTYCIIEDHNKKVLFEGVAKCASNDQFCKDIGRKHALKRAIQTLDRDERTKIWKAYLNE